MHDRILIYRNRLIRAVTGMRPAALASITDVVAVDVFCQAMVDVEEAKTLLCAKGYGMPAQSLVDLVRELPVIISAPHNGSVR